MIERTKVVITNTLPTGTSFGVREDTGEAVFIAARLCEYAGANHGDIIDATLAHNASATHSKACPFSVARIHRVTKLGDDFAEVGGADQTAKPENYTANAGIVGTTAHMIGWLDTKINDVHDVDVLLDAYCKQFMCVSNEFITTNFSAAAAHLGQSGKAVTITATFQDEKHMWLAHSMDLVKEALVECIDEDGE